VVSSSVAGLLNVFVLAVVLRLLVSAGARAFSFWLLLAAPASFALSDGIWNWTTRLDYYAPGSCANVGWLLFPAALGAAALHPSMTGLFEDAPTTTRRLRWDRMTMLAVAAFSGPALWIVKTQERAVLEQGVEAVCAARVEGAAKQAIQGTGLGLWISKTIVDAHGGDIAVESRPGHGTSFRVALPVAEGSG